MYYSCDISHQLQHYINYLNETQMAVVENDRAKDYFNIENYINSFNTKGKGNQGLLSLLGLLLSLLSTGTTNLCGVAPIVL